MRKHVRLPASRELLSDLVALTSYTRDSRRPRPMKMADETKAERNGRCKQICGAAVGAREGWVGGQAYLDYPVFGSDLPRGPCNESPLLL